jgi:16S rRNA (cytidine1402-2'-O)-methyltransferase
MPTLYIVAAPFNNSEDISIKTLRILGEVDFILCEDTEVTKEFLAHYHIKTPALSYYEYSDLKKIDYVLNLLKKGKNLAFVSGNGMPGFFEISGKLAQAVKERLGDGVSIEFVPGPSAVTAALSMSGIPTDKFIFMGFPPHKKGWQIFIRKILKSDFPVVVYELKLGIIKFLEELNAAVETQYLASQKSKETQGISSETQGIASLQSVVVCRELSKMHETVYRSDIKTIIEKIKNNKDDQRGEFVIVIGR